MFDRLQKTNIFNFSKKIFELISESDFFYEAWTSKALKYLESLTWKAFVVNHKYNYFFAIDLNSKFNFVGYISSIMRFSTNSILSKVGNVSFYSWISVFNSKLHIFLPTKSKIAWGGNFSFLTRSQNWKVRRGTEKHFQTFSYFHIKFKCDKSLIDHYQHIIGFFSDTRFPFHNKKLEVCIENGHNLVSIRQ